MSHSYHKLLKYLYFEGYANSYAEAETLLSEMTEDEVNEIFYLSRLPRESLTEEDYLTRTAKAAEEKAAQRKKQKDKEYTQQSLEARSQKQRSGDTTSVPAVSKGRRGRIVYNRSTGERTFVPD